MIPKGTHSEFQFWCPNSEKKKIIKKDLWERRDCLPRFFLLSITELFKKLSISENHWIWIRSSFREVLCYSGNRATKPAAIASAHNIFFHGKMVCVKKVLQVKYWPQGSQRTFYHWFYQTYPSFFILVLYCYVICTQNFGLNCTSTISIFQINLDYFFPPLFPGNFSISINNKIRN